MPNPALGNVPPPSDVLPPANVTGVSPDSTGVRGVSTTGTGVQGICTSGDGVYGQSQSGIAIHGKGNTAGQFDGAVVVNGGLSANAALSVKGNLTASGALSVSGDISAGGNVTVTGDVTFVGGDCAEEIDAATDVEPGSVVIVGSSGRLEECVAAYDKRVVGIVSGAGTMKPAIILGGMDDSCHKAPLALSGRVFCKVDAQYSPIKVGDLLTTSSTPGHAMGAVDRTRAFGCVIGKALGELEAGRGYVPVLVSLQ